MVLFAAAVLGGVAWGMVQWRQSVDTATTAPVTRVPTSASIATPTLPTLELPPAGSRAVFIGDSWTDGYAADPGRGFTDLVAREFGWERATLSYNSGTGYFNPGTRKYRFGTYVDRINDAEVDNRVRLVFVQGSLNDLESEHVDAATSTAINVAAETIIQNASQVFPMAQIVFMGPLDPNSVLPNSAIRQIDSRLRATAVDAGAFYISPTKEFWLSSKADLKRYIVRSAADHPGNVGHAYLARRVVEDLEAFSRGDTNDPGTKEYLGLAE